MGKRKMITREMTLDGVVNEAYSEFSNLRDEMQDWADNMESANMEHLPKYDAVSEARDALENFSDNEPDMPKVVPEGLVTLLTWEESGRKRRHVSRADRCSEAAALLDRAIAHVQEFLDAHDDDDAVWQAEGCDRDEWEQWVNDLTEAKDEAEAVDFPGMYG
jgi:sugar phosphate isomerase/epimerase